MPGNGLRCNDEVSVALAGFELLFELGGNRDCGFVKRQDRKILQQLLRGLEVLLGKKKLWRLRFKQPLDPSPKLFGVDDDRDQDFMAGHSRKIVVERRLARAVTS